MDTVSFSGSALVVVSGLLTIMSGAISLLFRALLTAKDDALTDCRTDRDDWRTMALDGTDAASKALDVAKSRSRGR